jgi:geranylgeranyl reductase family protein
MPEVLVVGAGPAGASAAALLAKEHDVLLIEEHAQVGLPVQCAGLVAPRVVEAASAHDCVLNRLHGAVITFPGGAELEFTAKECKAEVVDRSLLDKLLADRAVDAGAELRTSTRFVSIDGEGRYALRTERLREEVGAKVLIGADGYRSEVAKALDLPAWRDLVRGVEVDVDKRMMDQDKVLVWLGSNVAPGFFAWAIPCGDFTRVGLCVKRGVGAPSGYLDKLLRSTGLEGRIIARYSGQIPLGVRSRTYADAGLVVGDAAGQAKPISGGGVYTSFVAARCAAEAVSAALAQDDVSRKALSPYERRWRAELGKELENGYRARRIFVSMKDAALDKAGALLSEDKARAALSTGDIDHPMELAPRLLRAAPGLVTLLPMALRPLLFE